MKKLSLAVLVLMAFVLSQGMAFAHGDKAGCGDKGKCKTNFSAKNVKHAVK